MNVLTINAIHKTYGKLTAVNKVSLQVQRGDILGFLGPNGSGKTTTLGIVLGITRADSGSYRWFDETDEVAARKRIGAILETPNFYPYMNAVQNLRVVAHLKRLQNIDFNAILRLVGLYERRDAPFTAYSLGMRQRLAIAAALVGDPEVLIFDEPTNGLDPQGIADIRHLIQHIAAQGKTIIMASHILDEVEKICSHVAIIKNGNLLATGTVGAILSAKMQVEIACANLEKLKSVFATQNFVETIENDQNKRLLLTLREPVSMDSVNTLAFQNGLVLTHLVERKRSLEQEFLQITGRSAV